MNEKQEAPRKSRLSYVGVFIILVILTGIEVAVTYLPVPRVPILIPLSLAKASLVALFYMHLKTDKQPLALIFAMGLFIGIGLMLAMIAIYHPSTVGTGSLP